MRKFLRILSIILLVLWMGLIFFFSAQTADTSSQTSGQVIKVIAEKFYPDYEEMTETEREELISSLQFKVRKSAHIGMYAVLGFLAFITFISYVKLRFFTRTFWATAVSCLYALSDEFHQRFVVGRSCELRDFLLDTVGVLTAIIICSLFVKIISPLRRKTAFAGVTKRSVLELNDELNQRLDKAYYRNEKLEAKINEHKETIEKLELQIQQLESFASPQPEQKNDETEQSVEMEVPKEIEIEVCEEPETLDSQSEELEKVAEDSFLEVAEVPEESLEEIALEQVEQEITQEPLAETEKSEMKISDEMEYAAKVIGACVVEVTKVCNKLTEGEQDETKKELVNLALGRTEVLKAEILKIINMETELSQKKNLIEKEKQEAFDYFDSIIAQIS